MLAAFPFAKYAHYNDLGVFAVMTILFHYTGRLRFSLEREREREREREGKRGGKEKKAAAEG